MKVAIAVIIDGSGRILITRRPLHTSHGGQWEFPGGKLEDDETPPEALKREVMEEVGLEVVEADFLTIIEHSYGLKYVELFVYCVTEFHGTPSCCESQIDLRWIELSATHQFEFPEANKIIIDLLKRSRQRHLENETELSHLDSS